jgi:transketolase
MRARFIRTLTDLAARDPRIILLTGDLGYTVIEPFLDQFPDRFFNVGVAEQNMIGLATGLAESGLIPFTYSIATFATLRPYEFIRNGPVLHHLPVRIVGVGGGLEYGTAGLTHHALEDVGVMRIQPGLSVIAPADAAQAETALRATWDHLGPVYYRLGKDESTLIPGLDGRFEPGRIQIVREGSDVLILAMGPIASVVMGCADDLVSDGIQTSVAVVASLNPPPAHDLVELLGQFRVVFTVETHYVTGGLGSLVAEVIADNGLDCRLVRRGVTALTDVSGSEAYLLQRHGLTRDALVDSARTLLAPVS